MSLFSIISSADLSTVITDRKLELWMWSVSEKLGTVASLSWGPTGLLKTEGKKERERERKETSEHLLENPNWLVQLSSARARATAEELAGVATL